MASTDSSFNNADPFISVPQGNKAGFNATTDTNVSYSWLIRDNAIGGAYTEFSTAPNIDFETDEVPFGTYDIKLVSSTVEFGEGSTEKLAFLIVTDPEEGGGGRGRECESDEVGVADLAAYHQSILDRADDGWNLINTLVLNDKIRLTYGRES